MILSVLVMLGCADKFSRTEHKLDHQTTSSTKLKQAKKLKNFKTATLNLIKYKENNSAKMSFKFKINALHKGVSPEFRKGESLSIILNEFEKISLSTDGEVNVAFNGNTPVRAAFYDVSEQTLRKIIKARTLRFLAKGKAYDVAGVIPKSQLTLFKDLLEEDEEQVVFD